MTFTAETTYFAAALVYAVAVVGFSLWLRRLPDEVHRLGKFLIGMLAVSTVVMLLMWQGIGRIPIDADRIVGIPIADDALVDVPRYVGDVVAYTLVFVATGVIAGLSSRQLVGIGALIVAMRTGFEVSNFTDGLVSLLGALVMLGGYVVFLYLFWGPIWRRADAYADARRLLYWKCRNLIMFLFGMLILLAVLALVEATYAAFVIEANRQYMDVLIRVGYVAFVFASVGRLPTLDWLTAATGSVADR